MAMGTADRWIRRAGAALLAAVTILAAAVWAAPTRGTAASAEGTWVDSTLAKMTLAEKVGQMFVVKLAATFDYAGAAPWYLHEANPAAFPWPARFAPMRPAARLVCTALPRRWR